MSTETPTVIAAEAVTASQSVIASEARQSMPPAFQDEDEEDEINLLDTLQVIVDNLRLLVLGPLAVGVLALGLSFLVTPTFTAKVVFIPPKQQQSTAASALSDLAGLGGAAGAIAGVKNPSDQYIALTKSKSVADAMLSRFKLQDHYDNDSQEDTRKALAANTRIEAGGKDGLITLEFDDADPAFAANICNAYIDELRRLLNRVALTESQMRRVFFEGLVNESKTKMATAELALKTSGIDGNVLKLSATAALEGVARLKAQIMFQEVKLGTLRGYLTESAPEFRQGQTELQALRTQLAQSDKEETKSAGQSDYVSNFREFKYQEALLELYLRQYEMARLDEGREGAVVQVVDAAQPPERKSKPKKAQIALISTLAALLALLVFVFIRNSMRSEEKTPESEEKLARLRQSWQKALGRKAVIAPPPVIASEARQSTNS